MKKNLIAAVVFTLPALMLAACDTKVSTDDNASAALAAAEAKLAGMAAYNAQIAAVNTLIEVWDSAEVDKLDAIASSNYERTAPDQNASSLDELKAFIRQVHDAYPDYHITNDGVAAGPDGAFVQWTVTGITAGDDATSGSGISATGMSRYRFKDGKIASELVIFDTGAVLTQLDVDELPHTGE